MPGKRVNIDGESWMALDLLARDRMATFQELADEAFRRSAEKAWPPGGPEGGAAQERRGFRRRGQVQGKKAAQARRVAANASQAYPDVPSLDWRCNDSFNERLQCNESADACGGEVDAASRDHYKL